MIEQEFLDELHSHGFHLTEIIADGSFHRFDIKRNDKCGYYSLNPDNGFGVFGNWKTNEQFKFRPGHLGQMSADERAQEFARFKSEQRRRNEETKNKQAAVAIEANAIWNKASTAPEDHWYLADKKIKPHNARIGELGALLIPIYDNGKIVNLQRIIHDKKLFLPDAKKKGCFGIIDGESDVIFIAEGFATAASVNEATGKKCIIALDAGNLGSVARIIKKKFGVGQKIIIASDNDQWAEVKGELRNIGRIEAEKAGTEIFAEVKFPNFPADDPEHRTDWNDYAAAYGLQAVADLLLPKAPVKVNGHEILSPPKPNEIAFELDEKGKPKCTIENLRIICQQIGITVRYNVIKKQDEILIPGETFSVDNVINASFARLLSFCNQSNLSTANAKGYVTYLADKNLYNPIANWIKSKPWDGVSRLEAFYDTVQSSNKQLKETILQRWMVSAVAAVFEPNGISAHGVLVFQGEQYIGKTSWFKRLVPQELDAIKDGYILRLDNKDNVFQCLSHWLVELGELEATFKKSDIAQLKAFITSDRDILRRAYAAGESFYARRTIFFASVNQREFLFDDTGNRRFWTIETTSLDYNHNLDMQQVWAEFYELYISGEPWIMGGEEIKTVNTSNEEFMGPDYHDELVGQILDWSTLSSAWEWKTVSETTKIIGILNPKQSDLNKVAKAIKKRNNDQKKKGMSGVRLVLVPPLNGRYE